MLTRAHALAVHCGADGAHALAVHVRLPAPSRMYPSSHVYVAIAAQAACGAERRGVSACAGGQRETALGGGGNWGRAHARAEGRQADGSTSTKPCAGLLSSGATQSVAPALRRTTLASAASRSSAAPPFTRARPNMSRIDVSLPLLEVTWYSLSFLAYKLVHVANYLEHNNYYCHTESGGEEGGEWG